MQVIDIDNSYPMTKKERAEKRHNLAKEDYGTQKSFKLTLKNR